MRTKNISKYTLKLCNGLFYLLSSEKKSKSIQRMKSTEYLRDLLMSKEDFWHQERSDLGQTSTNVLSKRIMTQNFVATETEKCKTLGLKIGLYNYQNLGVN